MTRTISGKRLQRLFPAPVLQALGDILAHRGGRLYLVGGSVRDLLLDRPALDIDLTVDRDARGWARDLRDMLDGTLVPLGRDEDAARVVAAGLDIDFSSFRAGARTIEQELKKRDITINSMAVRLDPLSEEMFQQEFAPIDPLGGLDDLEQGIIRVSSKRAFRSDPLRMLRVYRFAASFDFQVDPATHELVRSQAELITKVAWERIARELELIMASDHAHFAFAAMADNGLLWQIFPELLPARGMEQPSSHHLDVFGHSLAALDNMERIIAAPQRYFGEYGEAISTYLNQDRHRIRLKWAALFHDLGKPATFGINEDKGNRITFYNHDREGAEIFDRIARRLRMSGQDRQAISDLIRNHMWPFHLNNVRRQRELSSKARLKIARKVGDELYGLFILSMADALAGKGEGRPQNMEAEIVDLLAEIDEVRIHRVQPVLAGPPLVSGRDLIELFELEPGPGFRDILDGIEEARMEKRITTRDQALEWVRKYLATGKDQRSATS